MQTATAAPAHTPDTGHPTGLYVLFTTEMWERFSYYGMRALLALYMVKALIMSKETSSLIYGNYTSLVYLTPLLGGYVADRYWGNRRSILVGGLLMAVGQFALFGSASMYLAGQTGPSGAQLGLFFLGLGFLIFGNGFFKPNISSMVGSLYPKGDKRIVLIDGEIAGAINRIPGEGEFRSNLAMGGSAEPTELTARELEICAVLGPDLKRLGLTFVGIDVIGGQWLTEINVTSPTGIVVIDRFNNTDTASMIWDAIEKRRQ